MPLTQREKIIRCIHDHGPLTKSEIVHQTRISQNSVSYHVSALKNEGCLKKSRSGIMLSMPRSEIARTDRRDMRVHTLARNILRDINEIVMMNPSPHPNARFVMNCRLGRIGSMLPIENRWVRWIGHGAAIKAFRLLSDRFPDRLSLQCDMNTLLIIKAQGGPIRWASGISRPVRSEDQGSTGRSETVPEVAPDAAFGVQRHPSQFRIFSTSPRWRMELTAVPSVTNLQDMSSQDIDGIIDNVSTGSLSDCDEFLRPMVLRLLRSHGLMARAREAGTEIVHENGGSKVVANADGVVSFGSRDHATCGSRVATQAIWEKHRPMIF